MPLTDEHYAHILAGCIDAVLTKRATVDACVQQYPQYADSLRQELRLALLTKKLKPVTMSDTKVDALQAYLMQAFDTRKIIRPRFDMWRKNAAAIIIAFLVMFVGSAGTVAASSNALPGDTLYAVKRWWESVVVFISTIVGNTETVLIHLAETRLDEIQQLRLRGADYATNLSDLASAIGDVLRYNNDLTAREYDFLVATHQFLTQIEGVQAIPSTQTILDEIVPLLETNPEQPPASDVLSDMPMTPTPTATVVPSVIVSPSPTVTPTSIPAITQVVTATPSVTPRIPPTPTRTSTPTPVTPIIMPTSTQPTPTPTWTAFPTSTLAPTVTPLAPVPFVTPPANTGNFIIPQPSVTWYPWQQATWDVCYLTRTVDPYGNQNDPYCNPTPIPSPDWQAAETERP
jgi:hypothetical protein